MSQTEPTPEVDDTDPEGPETGDRLLFVRTGWVRYTSGGTTIRVRPPFFGEFKRLRLALEDVQDTLMDLAEEAEAEAERIQAELDPETGDVPVEADGDLRARAARRRDLLRRSREVARRTNERREALMHSWWVDVFRTLCVDADKVEWLDDPDKMPAWMTNPALPQQFVNHWRAAPLARG